MTAGTEAPEPSASSPRRRVLVVDDDAEQLEELVELFNEAGISAASAKGASEALEMLATVNPQLMLVDIKMPGIDGIKLAGFARSLDRRVAVVLMSGDWHAAEESRDRDDGIFAVVTKPLDPAWLVETARALTV
ncbi:MAG: response regulator [Alphaproteobacteria bacterium]|nr:response regulator [Alphaproteobacteria bacterium]